MGNNSTLFTNTSIFLSSSSKTLDKCGCVVHYNSILTGWYQYLQLGYIVLYTSVNKNDDHHQHHHHHCYYYISWLELGCHFKNDWYKTGAYN